MSDLTDAELEKFGKRRTFPEKIAELEKALRSSDYESSGVESKSHRKYPKMGRDLFRQFLSYWCPGSELMEELSEVSSRREREDPASSSNESVDSREGSVDKMRIRDPKGKQKMDRKWRKIVSAAVGPKDEELHEEERDSESEDEDEDTSSLESDPDECRGSIIEKDGIPTSQSKWSSVKGGDKVVRSRVFWTKSRYEGQWDPDLDVPEGIGKYDMPHGVTYVGEMHDGCFHGKGVLRYPNGDMVEGVWDHGRVLKRRITFHDGLRYREKDWDYCSPTDRRFHIERLYGLRPAGRSHLTQDYPTRKIPDGCYDTGDGYYNHRTRCVYDADTRKVLRIPTNKEANWIMEHCRKAWDMNVNYEPDIFNDICDPDDVETLISPRISNEKEKSPRGNDTAAKQEPVEECAEKLEGISVLDVSSSGGKKNEFKERRRAPKFEIPFSVFSEPFRGSDEELDKGENFDEKYVDKIIESFERGKQRLKEKNNDPTNTNQ